MENITAWIGLHLKITELQKITRWMQKAKVNSFLKKLFPVVIAALVYWIWNGRDKRLWSLSQVSVNDITNHVKDSVKNRILLIGCKSKGGKYWDRIVKL